MILSVEAAMTAPNPNKKSRVGPKITPDEPSLVDGSASGQPVEAQDVELLPEPRQSKEDRLKLVDVASVSPAGGDMLAKLASDPSKDVRDAVEAAVAGRADASKILLNPEFHESPFGAKMLARIAEKRLLDHDDRKAFDAIDTLLISGKASMAARLECITSLWAMSVLDKRACELLLGIWQRPGTHNEVMAGHYKIQNPAVFVEAGAQMNFLTKWEYSKELAKSIEFYPGAVEGTRDAYLKPAKEIMSDDDIASAAERLAGLGKLLQVNAPLITLSKALAMTVDTNASAEQAAGMSRFDVPDTRGTLTAIPAETITSERYASNKQKTYIWDLVNQMQMADVPFPKSIQKAVEVMGFEAADHRAYLNQSDAFQAIGDGRDAVRNVVKLNAACSTPGTGVFVKTREGIASPKQKDYIRDLNKKLVLRNVLLDPAFKETLRVIQGEDPKNQDTMLKVPAASAAIAWAEEKLGIKRNRG
jgi:hypothetical protein